MLAGCGDASQPDRIPESPATVSASAWPDSDYTPPEPLRSAGPIPKQAHRILSDFGGRWHDSDVRYIGRIAVGSGYFELYYFDFVNPQTHHGTQLIAFLWDGKEFAGRYAINGHASGTEAVVTGLEGATITFTCDEPPPQRVERITIDNRRLPPQFWLCGKRATLQTDGI